MYFNTKIRKENRLYIRDLMEYLLAAGVKMENYKDYSKQFGLTMNVIIRAVAGDRVLKDAEKLHIERRLFEIEIKIIKKRGGASGK